MKIGAVFPQTEIGADPVSVRDYAQAVEGLGYDYLLAYDHVLGANPDRPGGWKGRYTYQHLFHEPLVLMGYLAAITRRVELVTGVVILPQRQTALVAKQAVEVDVLSGGRLRFGVGLGWNEIEYLGLGMNFHNRGRRIEEQVTLLRELWISPLVSFQGKDHTIDDAGLNPLPVQRPIPVWFGGIADAMLRRMARMGDGWISNPLPYDRLQTTLQQLRGYLEQEGRDPNQFGVDLRFNYSQTPGGSWRQEAERVAQLGVTHLCIGTMDAGFTHLDQHLDALQRFKADVGVL
jgi:probable F420-dependent oxidoreductase